MEVPVTIIYADDDDDLRELLAMLLEVDGKFGVKTVTDGRSAIRLAQAEPPDLFLLDVRMPEFDGPATLIELRSSGSMAPVVFLTALSHRDETTRLIARGAMAVLYKPFDPLTICDQLTAIWSSHCGAMRVELRRAELREKFIAELTADRDDLCTFRKTAGCDTQVAMILHRLAGRAGTFGFPIISEIAGKLEAHSPKNALLHDTIDALFEQLDDEIDAVVFYARK